MSRSAARPLPRIRVLATGGTNAGAQTGDASAWHGNRPVAKRPSRTGSGAGDSAARLDDLPDREYQVLWYAGHGYSVREIAEHLRVSVPTIETYRSRLKDKLGCDDHTDLLKCAIQWAHSNSAL
jgi:DNA-binding NarL/FixJ family response regulator